jgi:hypothetical protein
LNTSVAKAMWRSVQDMAQYAIEELAANGPPCITRSPQRDSSELISPVIRRISAFHQSERWDETG